MEYIFGGLFLAALVFIGITYWEMYQENKALKQEESRTPVRQIFIYDKYDAHMKELITMCLSAYRAYGINIVKNESNGDGKVWHFDNDDIVMIYQYGAQMNALEHDDINSYVTRVFFDDRLPDSAFRASINKLGLKNYLIGVGLCDQVKGGKNG